MKKTLYTFLGAILVVSADITEGTKKERDALRAELENMTGFNSLLPSRRTSLTYHVQDEKPRTLRRHRKNAESKAAELLPGQSATKLVRKGVFTAIPLPVVSSSPVVLDESSASKSGKDDSGSVLCSSPDAENDDILAGGYLDFSKKTLNLSGCTFDVAELIDILEQGANGEFEKGTLSSLHMLDFSGSNIDTVGVNALLTSIFGGRAGGKRFSVMAPIFAPRARIQWKKLNFSGCNIRDGGIRELIWALRNGYLPELRVLNFSGCNLSDECKQQLNEAVTRGRTIKVYY